jgi:hypothetical protein
VLDGLLRRHCQDGLDLIAESGDEVLRGDAESEPGQEYQREKCRIVAQRGSEAFDHRHPAMFNSWE